MRNRGPLGRADRLFDIVHRGVGLEVLNLGGGLAAHYRAPVPPLADYAEAIEGRPPVNSEVRDRGC